MVAHNNINFNLRPSKRVERRFIVDTLTAIYRFNDPKKYGYIGLGSIYFTDFKLFHKTFDIQKMISIESHAESIQRCTFNRPYDCITILEGTTNDVLPSIELFDTNPVICWLDYYSYLTTSVLSDIETFTQKAQLGSFLVISVNSSALNSVEKITNFFADLPPEYNAAQYRRGCSNLKGLQDTMLKIIDARIQSLLSDINVGASSANKKQMLRILDISYKDNAPMLTFGWLLADKKIKTALSKAPSIFSNYKPERVEISSPALTFKEVNHLKSLLPLSLPVNEFLVRAKPVRDVDATRFAKFYRYFPQFADIEE